MSRALAAAKARRANVSTPEPPSQRDNRSQMEQSSQNGLTLPQVIALVDSRLVKLETFMKDTKESGTQELRSVRFDDEQFSLNNATNDPVVESEGTTVEEVLEDFNNRFVVLANEIAELKDIVLKLQSYTMDVNKSLLEDRVRILSDLGQNEDPLFVMNNSNEEITTESVSGSTDGDQGDSNVRFSFSTTTE